MSLRGSAEQKVAMDQTVDTVDDDTDDDVDDDEGDIKDAEMVETDLTKKYQMNVIDLYEWHLESDDKLIKILNDKIKQSESENEKSDEDVRLELNTKCLELKHNAKGVHFIKEWQKLRAKIMANVGTASGSDSPAVKKKIQDHKKKIQKMKESTQNAMANAMATGLMLAGVSIAATIGPQFYQESQESYIDDFNDFKSILYTLEELDQQGNFKIHDWMNEINSLKNLDEEEQKKVLESMKDKITEKKNQFTFPKGIPFKIQSNSTTGGTL